MYNQNMYYPANVPAAQQRLQMLEQQNPQFAQQYAQGFQMQQPQQIQQMPQMQQVQQVQPQQQGIKCFQVTSIDEAKAYMVDFDGTLTVFVNVAQGQIYTKQLGLNGAPSFNVYTLQPQQQASQMMQQQAPVVNVDAIKNDFVSVNDYKNFQQDVYNKLSKLSDTMTNIDNALGGLQNEQ